MGALSRNKGKAFERTVCVLLRRFGYTARRAQQYKGSAGSADVESDLPFHIECKHVRKEAWPSWTAQCERDCGGKLWVIFHRVNRGEIMATVRVHLIDPSQPSWVLIHDAGAARVATMRAAEFLKRTRDNSR
jgi:hypothetical protein